MLIFKNIIKFFTFKTFKTSGFYFGRILVNFYTLKSCANIVSQKEAAVTVQSCFVILVLF